MLSPLGEMGKQALKQFISLTKLLRKIIVLVSLFIGKSKIMPTIKNIPMIYGRQKMPNCSAKVGVDLL